LSPKSPAAFHTAATKELQTIDSPSWYCPSYFHPSYSTIAITSDIFIPFLDASAYIPEMLSPCVPNL